MDNIIEKLKSVAFSGEDILNATDHETKILRYPDIHNFENIDELLNPYNCAVILYETKFKYGHWVCVILHPNNELEFFDPYGFFIDDEMKFIKNDYKKISNQNYPYLSKLFLDSPYEIVVNKAQLQKKENDISSCGRHVALRIIMRELTLIEYLKTLKNNKRLNSDDIVTYMTAFV